MRKKFGYLGIIAALGALVYYSLGAGNGQEAYETAIREKRLAKETYLRTGTASPFVLSGTTPEDLSYFPIEEDYKVTAVVDRITERQVMRIQNSDGTSSQYLKYAWLTFELKEQPMKLLVLKPAFSPGFFLGFADETSGDSTYGGGRYLDLSFKNASEIIIDFNLAYNPYCEYTPDFSCPLPPKENILPIAITAGEKQYKID